MGSSSVKYPFVPKSNAKVQPGQLWSLPLSTGWYGCARVLLVNREASYGSRTAMVVGLLDWLGREPPTPEAIQGRRVVATGQVHVRAVGRSGGQIVGERALPLDDIAPPERVQSYWADATATELAERRFLRPAPPPPFERRSVGSPLTAEMVAPFTSPTGAVQFKSALTDRDYQRLAALLDEHPAIGLRAYGSYDGSITDLEFLRYFKTLRNFSADCLYASLSSFDGLRHLREDLDTLALGTTKARLPLDGLARFTRLRRLHLEGQTKGIEVLAQMGTLQELTLRSITLRDLSLLTGLDQLWSLDVKLGGTRDLGLLNRIGRLRYLELWMIKGLSDLAPIAQLTELRVLFLQALRNVTSLPDLSGCAHLAHVHLETMKGLTSLDALATAPALESISVLDTRQLQPDHFSCLVGHPTLQSVTIGLGSSKKNEAIEELLGIPTRLYSKNALVELARPAPTG